MSRLPLVLLLPAAFMACSNVKDPDFGDGEEVEDSDTDDTSDTEDTDDSGDTSDTSDTDDTSETGDSGDTGTGDGFDDPGDAVGFYDDGEGVVSVDLTDSSGDSNRDQEFLLVLLNGGASEVGYRLRYFPSDAASLPAPPERSAALPSIREDVPLDRSWRPASPPPPPIDAADIGTAEQEFLVRSDLYDDSQYLTVSATLWAYGDNVAIWVDNDVPIDWDQDCDGTVDVPHPNPAFGFDNCDLTNIADIVDDNIVPNLRSFFGEESDLNGDGRIAVVISPVLNVITLTSDSEFDHYRVLSSYTEPSVDLQEFDSRVNPGSDEQEVVYVYAPDPYGFYNPLSAPGVDTFTGFQLAGEIARSLTALISYNQHVLEAGGAVEEDWVNDAMGTLAADLCGFGAAYYVDAWEYLDAPNLHPLVSTDTSSNLDNLARGAQYTFARYLYDRAEADTEGSGVGMMTQIMQGGQTGVDSIEAGTGEGFDGLVLGWQVALLTDGILNADGDPIVDPAEWPGYADPSTISAPPSSPGDNYGANGYQLGLEVRGENRAWSGGTTEAPVELATARVRVENQDPWLYTPGFEFNGYVNGGYAADVVRLTGITYDEAVMQLEATGTGLLGVVVRWNDPTRTDYTVEESFSVTEVNPILLPTFPTDYSVIRGVGQLFGTANVTVFDEENDYSDEALTVIDTDRWMLDLSARTGRVRIAVWLDRHFANTSGDSGPSDPWVAVVPEQYVPVPNVTDTRTNGACPSGPTFNYPTSMLGSLFYQQFLSNVMYADAESPGSADYSLGVPGTVTDPACELDWDLDGVADADEPRPDTLIGQITVQQYTLSGNAPPLDWYDTNWMDFDELDEDELYTRNLRNNTGGRSGIDGEEGYVEVDVQGGQRYLLIVGDSGASEGTYEIAVRELE